jgi:hypothetical protein
MAKRALVLRASSSSGTPAHATCSSISQAYSA